MVNNGEPRNKFKKGLVQVLSTSHSILDIETPKRFSKELYEFRNLFEKNIYTTAGYRLSNKYGEYNCDAHLDIQEISSESNSFDAVICIDVLEHAKDPNLAISEIHRFLRRNKKLFLTAPFMNGFHGKSGVSGSNEEYGDYWRFTQQV
jgi:SAM-dependent methyltransferase